MGPAHSTDELIEMSTALAQKNGYLHNGELAVVTAGVPVGVSGTTNMIKIHMVGNCLATGVGVGRGKTDLVSASGKACVCRTLEEVKAKFRPGMVLVVPSTTNEMLGYVRDAAALVVEEPGLNSHAAIVGNSCSNPPSWVLQVPAATSATAWISLWIVPTAVSSACRPDPGRRTSWNALQASVSITPNWTGACT